MSMFDFSETASISNSTSSQLTGNKIHTVIFNGCEERTIDTDKFKGNVLDIKFSNEEGSFTHTIFEPKPSDAEDRDGQFGKQPSNIKAMMMLFNHLIKAVNPELSNKIVKGEVKITAKNWEELKKIIIKATDPGKGKETQIKLINNSKGYPAFPGFYANYNRQGELYMNTNFIGNNLTFTQKELKRINQATTAKPTNIDLSFESAHKGTEDLDDLNLDF